MNNGINKISITLLFIISTLLFSQYSMADIEQPAGRETQIVEYFDKQAIPSQVYIWETENTGYDSSNPAKWAKNGLICQSSSNPINGQCPTVTVSNKTGTSSIPLTFIEKRSKLRVVLNVAAWHIPFFSPDDSCSTGSTSGTKLLINSGMYILCGSSSGNQADGSLVTAYISQSEIKKLPVGGIWEAELKMQLWQWSPYINLGNWNAHIKLNVSDTSNQAIYFPSFGAGQGKDAQPHVDLNLRPLPGGDRQVLGRLNGSTSLDMCLYDGYGSNSRSFQVQLSEPPEYPTNPEGRQAGQFSVYNDTGNRNAVGNRIDYGVKMYFPGSNSFQDVVNGTTYTLDNINTDDIRAVRLASNISNVVLCVPTPLQINTPAFNIVDKTTGHYTGKIRVVFTPSLW